ncbi:hypothetical protein BH11BAC7_BH11BAC7_09200 [soil metagenome]
MGGESKIREKKYWVVRIRYWVYKKGWKHG